MKKIVLLLLSLAVYSVSIIAQNSITVGSSGDYTTFNAAIDAKDTWYDAANDDTVFVNIASGTYDRYVETTLSEHNGYDLSGFKGTASKPIVFQSASGNAADVILTNEIASTDDRNVFYIQSSSEYLVFRNLTFKKEGKGKVIEIKKTFYTTFENCVFENTSITSGSDYALISSNTSDALNNVTIRNNTFTGGSYGIYLRNSGSKVSDNLVIENNTFDGNLNDDYKDAIRIENYDSILIKGNTFINPLSGQSDRAAIRCSPSVAFIINNTFKNENGKSRDILISGEAVAYPGSSVIANNTFEYEVKSSSESVIQIDGATMLGVYYNTIKMTGSQSGMIPLSITGTSANIDVKNNIIYNAGDQGYAISHDATGSNISINYNNYYTPDVNVVFASLNGVDTDFATWQSNGYDVQSLTGDPVFITDSLYISETSPLAAAGIPVSVTVDMDGNERHLATPSIGVNEIVKAAADMLITPRELSFGEAGGSDNIAVTSNADWTLQLESGADSWLSLDVASGVTGEDITVSVTASATNLFVTRSAKIYGLQSGVIKDSIIVAQDGQIALTVQDNVTELLFAGVEDTKTVTIDAGLSWTVSNGGDTWLSFTPETGMAGNDQVISITASANTGAVRTATVTISAGDEDTEIAITQRRMPLTPEWIVYDCSVTPDLNTPAFTVDNASGGTGTVSVGILDFQTLSDGDIYWSQEFTEDFDYYDGFTVMARLKATDPALDRVAEFELKGDGYREKMKIMTDNEVEADKGKTEGGTGEKSVVFPAEASADVLNDYIVVRFAFQVDVTRVWINEEFAGEFTTSATDGVGKEFGFGTSSSNTYGALIDYIIWDETGAYAPNEGAPIPPGLQIPTAIEDGLSTESLSIYPNPSNGSFIIANQKGANLDVMTLDGRVVYSKSNISASEQVTIDAKSGIYLVKVGELVNKIAIK